MTTWRKWFRLRASGATWLRKWLPAVAATLVLAVVADTVLAQCPMCRTALGSPEGQQLAAAFRGGILLLVAVPFAAVATIALLVARQLRAAARLEAASVE
ncbi:MAG: hypothetical protein GY719_15645 [bacterium]|nr:hypothetical protein [bacterium]